MNQDSVMLTQRATILFLCTGNSARSIMAEAIANHLFGDQFDARSAGSNPKPTPNPLAIETLRRHDIPTADLHSQSWGHFLEQPFDLVVTLCDSAACETCPTFPGAGTTHWSFPDPPAADDPEAMFEAVYLRTGRGDRPVRSDPRRHRPTRCGSGRLRTAAIWASQNRLAATPSGSAYDVHW